MVDPLSPVRKLGHLAVDRIWRLGFAVRFMFAVLRYSGASFRRLPLTLREIYFSGVLSLLIIMVSGSFVGLVLGLQGYEILQRFGSTEALGIYISNRPGRCHPGTLGEPLPGYEIRLVDPEGQPPPLPASYRN